VTTWIDPRTGRPSDQMRPDPTSLSQLIFESPPSPQSLMDVITVGSPIAVDMSDSTSSSITSPKGKFFEPPQEERLLPIGLTRKNTTSSIGFSKFFLGLRVDHSMNYPPRASKASERRSLEILLW